MPLHTETICYLIQHHNTYSELRVHCCTQSHYVVLTVWDTHHATTQDGTEAAQRSHPLQKQLDLTVLVPLALSASAVTLTTYTSQVTAH